MKPYNVEIFTPDFVMVGNTNVSELVYKEDYLSADENSIVIFPIRGVQKQDYIRISRETEKYVGIITEITYGTDKSKSLMSISYKPFIEVLSTDCLFDLNKQGEGNFEDFIKASIVELFVNNKDEKQNIKGLAVEVQTATPGWYLHITPKESGGHYNIVNLLDSIVIPALQKYSIQIKAELDIQMKAIKLVIGRANERVFVIEADLPNIVKKNVVIKQVSADVNKLIVYDATTDYEDFITYYLHSDLGYDTKDADRMLPVLCEIHSIEPEEGGSFKLAAQTEAANVFSNLSYANLIELTMSNDDSLVHPSKMDFGQVVKIISDKNVYTSMLTGREIGKTTKLIFGTVRIDLTKILRRNVNGG